MLIFSSDPAWPLDHDVEKEEFWHSFIGNELSDRMSRNLAKDVCHEHFRQDHVQDEEHF